MSRRKLKRLWRTLGVVHLDELQRPDPDFALCESIETVRSAVSERIG